MRIDFTTGGLGLRHASPEYCALTVYVPPGRRLRIAIGVERPGT